MELAANPKSNSTVVSPSALVSSPKLRYFIVSEASVASYSNTISNILFLHDEQRLGGKR